MVAAIAMTVFAAGGTTAKESWVFDGADPISIRWVAVLKEGKIIREIEGHNPPNAEDRTELRRLVAQRVGAGSDIAYLSEQSKLDVDWTIERTSPVVDPRASSKGALISLSGSKVPYQMLKFVDFGRKPSQFRFKAEGKVLSQRSILSFDPRVALPSGVAELGSQDGFREFQIELKGITFEEADRIEIRIKGALAKLSGFSKSYSDSPLGGQISVVVKDSRRMLTEISLVVTERKSLISPAIAL